MYAILAYLAQMPKRLYNHELSIVFHCHLDSPPGHRLGHRNFNFADICAYAPSTVT